jgi:F-type H+-transporting ATPase subunit a
MLNLQCTSKYQIVHKDFCGLTSARPLSTLCRRRGEQVRIKLQTLWVALLLIVYIGLGADLILAAGTGVPASEKEEGLSQKPVEIARAFGFPITNSMVATWIVALGLIVFVQVTTRKMKQVPDGAQNFLEWLVESLYTFLEGLLGRHLVDRTFWFFATVFIFILATSWAGLIPGVGTIGRGYATAHGFKIDQPLFRGANADVNLTLAMALVFFSCWIFWALRENGPGGFLKELFAPKGESSGLLKVVLVVVFFASGLLEIISILFRPVSLSFRLYGNMFAGEKMLETMANLVPSFSWLLPIPFYFMELLVGVVQALVFMLLTAVFTLLICPSAEEGSTTATTATHTLKNDSRKD